VVEAEGALADGQGRGRPALKAFEVAIGTWDTVGTHPYLPGKTLRGRATFEWMEGGAFLIMRSESDEPGHPSGIAIFGSDDGIGEFYMLYFESRDVSRKYDVTIEGNITRWQRISPDFSQVMVLTVAEDGKTIVGKGEMSKDGGRWKRISN
jgi:hypothetical protein